jgi:hypothetical protein
MVGFVRSFGVILRDVMSSENDIYSSVVAKFVFAAERLMIHDVKHERLSDVDLKAIRYYLECLSDKFSPGRCNPEAS